MSHISSEFLSPGLGLYITITSENPKIQSNACPFQCELTETNEKVIQKTKMYFPNQFLIKSIPYHKDDLYKTQFFL